MSLLEETENIHHYYNKILTVFMYKRPMRMKYNDHKAFTLIELSIVLVIIGLIVGGVLVGQDLIKAAQIRNVISKVGEFNTATNTFRLKYNGLPGDLRNYSTFSGTLTTTGLDGSSGFGNGDRIIGEIGTTFTRYFGERKLFWKHLSEAGLINEDTSLVTTAIYEVIVATGTGYVPKTNIDGSFMIINNHNGVHYYGLGGINIMSVAAGNTISTDVIAPIEAYQIDAKLDDGAPHTGVVVSANTFVEMSTAPNGGASSGNCYDTDTDEYAIADTAEASAKTCVLRIRAGF